MGAGSSAARRFSTSARFSPACLPPVKNSAIFQPWPKRSTLAYANEHRPWQLYRSVFYQLLSRCRQVAGPHGFRFRNKLLSLDATLIELCATVFDWAQYRRTKGAAKLHLLLDHLWTAVRQDEGSVGMLLMKAGEHY